MKDVTDHRIAIERMFDEICVGLIVFDQKDIEADKLAGRWVQDVKQIPFVSFERIIFRRIRYIYFIVHPIGFLYLSALDKIEITFLIGVR